MKLLHFPDNPTSIFIAAGVMFLASALSIIDLGLSAGGFSVGLVTAVPGAGLAIGILYRSYLVWIAATLLASVNAIMHAFQMFDIDSDGRITREEFVSALTRKCAKDGGAHSLTEDQANALVDEADVDRSNCIDAEEVNKMRRRTSTTHLILFRPFYFSR